MAETPSTKPTVNEPQPRKSWAPNQRVVIVMLVLSVCAVVLAILTPVPHRFRSKPQEPPIAGNLVPVINRVALPDFTLTERSGKQVSLSDLRGKTWLVSFVFTRCTMGCPSITGTMQKLQKELNLAERDDLVFVTITVDPERDQLKDLQEYATKFGAHETKWLFLTGTEEVVRPLLKEGFKVSADRKPDGKPGDEFDHTTKLAVIDKHGRLCQFFDGKQSVSDPEGKRFDQNLTDLKKVVEQLVNEPMP